MTTTTEIAHIVTACPIHGTKEVSDYASFVVYVEAATECVIGREAEDMEGTEEHTDWHLDEGHDCWKCCNLMVTDPYGVLDH